MAFATRTLIDTGSTSTGSGKIVIMCDFNNHDGTGLILDGSGIGGFAANANVSIRRIRWGLVSGDISEDGSGSVLITFEVPSGTDVSAIRLAGSGYYDGPGINGSHAGTGVTSADVNAVAIHATGFAMIEFSKTSGFTA